MLNLFQHGLSRKQTCSAGIFFPTPGNKVVRRVKAATMYPYMRKSNRAVIIGAGGFLTIFALAAACLAATASPSYGQQTQQYPAAQATQPQMVQTTTMMLKPGADWVKDKMKLTYLPQAEVTPLIDGMTSALLLQKGQITFFKDTVYIYASPDDIKKTREMFASADKEPRHIIFEATLISVDTDRVKDIGADLAKSYADEDNDRTHLVQSTTDFGVAGNFSNTVVWTYTQGANTLLMTVGYLLEKGAAEVVSKPVLRVRNNGTGTFQIVTNVPQKTVSDKGTKIEYKPTGISITIKEAAIFPAPPPKADAAESHADLIWAKLEVTDGQIGLVTTEGITTNDTVVKNEGYYRSGDTYIIASLVKDTQNYRLSYVPGLYKIPLIGNFFKAKVSDKRHTETIILMRPTIEEKMTHQFLASQLQSSQDYLSIKLGGRNRDSINVHPFSDAMWKGVPAIYSAPDGHPASYWSLAKKFSGAEIEQAALLFKKVRNRVGLILGQSDHQITQQIMRDPGIEDAIAGIGREFKEKFGKEPPAPIEFLVCAAHHGVLNQWAFDVYMERIAAGTKK